MRRFVSTAFVNISVLFISTIDLGSLLGTSEQSKQIFLPTWKSYSNNKIQI